MRQLVFNLVLICAFSVLGFTQANQPNNSANSSAAASSCLSINLYDSFGDGWGKVLFYYETPGAEYSGYSAPMCSSKYVNKKICGHKDGFYFLVVQSGDSENPPENTWEIRWTVEIEKTGQLFTGGYNTSLVFDYDQEADDFRIVYWHDMWSNTLNMTTCGTSSSVLQGSCQPSPGKPDLSKPSPGMISRPTPQRVVKHPPTASPVSNKIISGKRGHRGARRLDANDPEYILSLTDAVAEISNVTESGSGGGGGSGNSVTPEKKRKYEEIRKYRLNIRSEAEASGAGGGSTAANETAYDYADYSNSSDSGAGASERLYSSLVKSPRSRVQRLKRGRRGSLLKGNSNAGDLGTSESVSDDQSASDATNTTESETTFKSRDESSRIVKRVFSGSSGGDDMEGDEGNSSSIITYYEEDSNSTESGGSGSGGSEIEGVMPEGSRVRAAVRRNMKKQIKKEIQKIEDEIYENFTGNDTEESFSFLGMSQEEVNETMAGGGGVSGDSSTRAFFPIFRTVVNRKIPNIVSSRDMESGAGGESGNETISDVGSMYGSSGNESYVAGGSGDESSDMKSIRTSLIKEIVRRYRRVVRRHRSSLIQGGGGGGGGDFASGNDTMDEIEYEIEDYPTGMPTMYMSYNDSDSWTLDEEDSSDSPSGISRPTRIERNHNDRSHIFKSIGSVGGNSETEGEYNGTDYSGDGDSFGTGMSSNSSESEGGGNGDSFGSGISLIGISSSKRSIAKTDRRRPDTVTNTGGGGRGGGDGGGGEEYNDTMIVNLGYLGGSHETLFLLSDSVNSNYTDMEHSDSIELDFLRPSRQKATKAPTARRNGRGRVEVEESGGGNGGGDEGNSTLFIVPTGMPTAMEFMYYNGTESGEDGETEIDNSRNIHGNTGGLFKGQYRKRVSSGAGSDEEMSSNSTEISMNSTYVPTWEPTDSGRSSGRGRRQGNSGGLLKGSVAKRTRRHANHHHTASPVSLNVEFNAEANDSAEMDYLSDAPSYSPTYLPTTKMNMTLVTSDEDESDALGSSSGSGVDSSTGSTATTSVSSSSSSVSSSTSTASATLTTPKKKLGRNKHMHTKVTTGTPSASLKVEMVSSYGEGWYKPNYDGIAFYISDESKTELLAYGSLANGSYYGFCEFCFDDGSYYFRVSTPEDHNTVASWAFCNTVGNYGQQLAFHIQDGVCIPDALLDVDMICDATYSTVVTVQGTLTLTGVASEVMDSGSVWVLTTALSESVVGWDSSAVYISKTVLSSHPFELNTRALSAFTYDVQFEASFVSEIAYEIDGTSYYGVQGLVEELKEELSNTIASGSFAETVRTLAISTDVTALDDVYGVALLSLSVEDIMYMGTKEIISYGSTAEIEAQAETESTKVYQDMFSSQEFISFVCMVAIGLVSFVGVITVSVKLRRPSSATHDVVHDDSMHSEAFMSNHEVAPTRTAVRANIY